MIVDRVRAAVRTAWALGCETYEQWRDHRTVRLGAGIAYYGLFALVPLLALALAIAGLVISRGDVQSYLTEQLSDWLGIDAEDIARALTDALDGTGTLTGLGILGAVSLFLTASVLVVAVQDAFNTIWERPVRPGLRHTVMRRLVAFAVIAGAGAVVIASFVLNSVAGLITRLMPDAAFVDSFEELFGAATSWALGLGVVTLLLRYLTDARVPWPAAFAGGAATAGVLALSTSLIGAYLRRYAASSLVGVTGSVFLVLVWIFLVGQIVLVGAEFTRVLVLRGIGTNVPSASAGGDGETGVGPGDDATVDIDR
ncbi:MAG TPA: YihY/virulence factor BrkB family protein [Ilumatobacteraceae bacterium]|nr:YihY/virulence factor BrkB family protein [Ilumatobacteraceae bacterium]